MSSNRPNLFVIGAAKCGTTSLHHHLSSHPDIFMSEPKEPGFFAEGIDYYPSDEDWYLSLFEQGRGKRYRGESSTHYTKLPTYPGVARRISEYCPSPRFIYLMRDPIERAISHYWHRSRKGEEFTSPMRAMRNHGVYKAYGDYPRQLSPYLDSFSPDQLYTATFEQLTRQPEEVTSTVLEWLDLDPELASGEFPAKNRAPHTIERLAISQKIGEFIHRSQLWSSLSPLVPQKLKDLGRRFTTRELSPSEYPMDDVIAYLRPWARDVAERTSDLLNRDFPEWKTTMGST